MEVKYDLDGRCKPWKKTRALELRERMTEAERHLWWELADWPAWRGRWRSQAVIRGWIVDFFHPRARLIVEVDGPYHDTAEQMAKDFERDMVLERLGLLTMRYSNEEVMAQRRQICGRLRKLIQRRISVRDIHTSAGPCGVSGPWPPGPHYKRLRDGTLLRYDPERGYVQCRDGAWGTW